LVKEDRGHARENLELSCIRFDEGSEKEKVAKLIELVTPFYEKEKSVIIFCSTRPQTETLARKLDDEGLTDVAHYHGVCTTEHRKGVQEGFIGDTIRVIVATNAFGMGVDKPNVRLVVHYDVPGSIENYVQEAGRAGRDDHPSQCVLFFDPQDLDTQLDLRRRNQLTRNELKRVVLTIQHRFKQAEKNGEEFPEIIISALDLMTSKIDMLGLIGQDEDEVDEVDGSSAYVDEDDNSITKKVATALGILEEANHLERKENVFQAISTPFRISAWDQIEQIINGSALPDQIKSVVRSLAEYLFEKAAMGGGTGSVDLEVVADQFGIDRKDVKARVENLRAIGVCNTGVEYSIEWVRHTADDSRGRLQSNLDLLKFLIESIEANPEMTYSSNSEEINIDSIRIQSKRNGLPGYPNNRAVLQDLSQLANWGLFTIDQRKRGKMLVTWKSDLDSSKERLKELSNSCLLLLQYLDANQNNKGIVTGKFNHDQFRKWFSSQPNLFKSTCPEEAQCEDALLYMHRRNVIAVVDGFSILRARMKLVPQKDRLFSDYRPAYTDYQNYAKTAIGQVKAMARYAEYLSKDPNRASAFLNDYFANDWDSFTTKHFTANERKNLDVPVRIEQYRKVFGSLTAEQSAGVKFKGRKNYLVLAGPGSGKTHVLICRVFHLIKVQNVPAKSIALLAYNRHAAIEIRRRLKQLLPKDWKDISVHTFHGLALRIIGRDRLRELQTESRDIVGEQDKDKPSVFDRILDELCDELNFNSDEDDYAQLRWLDKLSGIEYLLVDEFQDVSEREYRIVKLLGRLNGKKRSGAVSVMAVGDDDQNINEFRGSSVEWIRKFEEDFKVVDRITLLDNFRSVQPVIEVASRFIARNENRMKLETWVQRIPDSLKESRSLLLRQDPDGGLVVRLKVENPADARFAIASEITRMKAAFPDLNYEDFCIAHHTNSDAHLSNRFFSRLGLPSEVLGEHKFAQRYQLGVIEAIRELEKLDQDKSTISYSGLEALVNSKFSELNFDDSWRESWGTFFDENLLDVAPDYEMPVEKMLWRIDEHLIGRTGASTQEGKVACMTLHGTKGLQFHTMFLFPPQFGDNREELRRLYFVGLSRAKVKDYLIDWYGCQSDIWDEMEELSGDWLTKRPPQPGRDAPTPEEIRLSATFQHFDQYKILHTTGVYFSFVAHQSAIQSLKKDQEIQLKNLKPSGTMSNELRVNNSRIGYISEEMSSKLSSRIEGDWLNIIGVEVAQILQSETSETNRKYNNGSETHYYVIPRIFYRKP
jgi:ATP-dependent DNA helicase RecQ